MEFEVSITQRPPNGRLQYLTALYRQLSAVLGSGVVPEGRRGKSMARWSVPTPFGHVEVYDYKVGTCYRGDGLELGQITEWHVDADNANATGYQVDLVTGEHRVRRHLIAQYGVDRGMEYVSALARSFRWEGEIEQLDPERAVKLAATCWLAEQEADHDLEAAIDELTSLRDYIACPVEGEYTPGEDGKSWGRWVSAGTMDELIISLQRLADARNHARPVR